MKKLTMFLFVIFVSVFALFQLNGCGDEVITNIPVTTTKGVFVLYEGGSAPGSSDYSFINPENDSVNFAVFQNSNSGAFLNSFSNGMLLSGNELFIASQGTFGQPGSMYRINSTTNQLIHSNPSIGNNPYNFDFANGNIYVTNTGSDYVMVVDMNFNTLVDSISVGFNPADILFAGGNVFVGKQSYAFEKSLAIINSNNQVSKIFFEGAPVSIAHNSGKIYVSTYSYKKLFVVDASTAQVTDSIDISIPQAGTGYVVSGDSRTLYVLGTDTAFQYNLGKSIYKVDLVSKSIDPSFTINFTGFDDIYGIDYDAVESKIYVANSKGGSVNGEVRVYNISGVLLKIYSDIGGKFPRRFAFKY